MKKAKKQLKKPEKILLKFKTQHVFGGKFYNAESKGLPISYGQMEDLKKRDDCNKLFDFIF